MVASEAAYLTVIPGTVMAVCSCHWQCSSRRSTKKEDSCWKYNADTRTICSQWWHAKQISHPHENSYCQSNYYCSVVGFWYTLAWRMGRMTGGALSNTFCSSSIVPVHTKLIRQCLTDNHPRSQTMGQPTSTPSPIPSSHHPFHQTAPTYHGSRCTLCCIHYCQTGRGYNYLLYQLELFLNRGLYI